MSNFDFTDDNGRHVRLNATSIHLGPRERISEEDGTWTYSVVVKVAPDKDGNVAYEWADGYQPADFNN